MNWHIGTMGFSYSDWKNVFYPNDMPARKYLAYYSRVFNSVEIDSTFYGTPRAETVARWKTMTPEDFTMSVKVPRAITHDGGLVNVTGLMEEFLSRMMLLGDKLGVILLQFPPLFTSQKFVLLENFLDTLSADFRYAVEIRDPSWFNLGEDFSQLLRSNSVCWAATEYPGLPLAIIPTTDFCYIRWIGLHGRFSKHDQVRMDLDVNLLKWLEQIQQLSPRVKTLFGYFNNDYAGFAAGSAHQFLNLAGLPAKNIRPPQQGKLF